MIKSKSISDYFDISLSQLKPDRPIGFDLYLYFSRNKQIILWRPRGEFLTRELYEKNRAQGLAKLWIHRDDREAWERYLRAEEAAAAGRTEQGDRIATLLNDPELETKRKQAYVAKEARSVLNEMTAAKDRPSQFVANLEARQIVKDILDQIPGQAGPLLEEIWKMLEIDPDLEHALNVSIYTVMFSMAFGKIDPELIKDLALAGLVHDVGLTQISAEIASIQWVSMTPVQLREYSQHVERGVSLLERHGSSISERAREITRQHHEKFDGSGYPRGTSGAQIDDVAQLLSIADFLDAIASGQWDGKKRTLKEAFDLLEQLEKSEGATQHFNSHILRALLKWTRKTASPDQTKEALNVVQSVARKIVA